MIKSWLKAFSPFTWTENPIRRRSRKGEGGEGRGGDRERERERERVGRVTEALKVMRDRDVWKVIIAYAKGHGT